MRTRETTPGAERRGAISTTAKNTTPRMRHGTAEERRRAGLRRVGEGFIDSHGGDFLAALGALVLDVGRAR